MKLIYLGLMDQWLKNTRNELGRRRKRKVGPPSLNVELMKMKEWRVQFFFHNGQGDKACASRWQGLLTLEWPLGWPFWTCHFMPQMGSFAFCKTTKNGRDRICQKWVFLFFIPKLVNLILIAYVVVLISLGIQVPRVNLTQR